MKKLILIGLLLLAAGEITPAQPSEFPKLTGPYLGQKLPGETPEIFAPGIISTENSEHGTATFSPKGDEVFWAAIFSNPFRKKILYSKIADGRWTEGKNLGEKINSKGIDIWPIVSPDGKYLFFTSRRDGNQDIYWVNRAFIENLRPDKSSLK